MTESRYEAGMKARREVMGEDHVDKSLAASDDLTRPLQDLVAEFGWGAIWTRPGLDRRTRSLVTIAMLTALNHPHELRGHLKGALNNGCTREEIVETVIHTAAYCGFPAALDGMRHAKAVFDQADAPA